MMPALAGASLGVLLSTAAFGQAAANPTVPSPAAPPKFEVASVRAVVQKPVDFGGAGRRGEGGGCPLSFKMDRSRIDIECATLVTLIGYAFRMSPDRVTGPDWMGGLRPARFNIAANLPPGAAENRIPEMLQALLADRFKLAIHHGVSEQAIYALVVAKGGLKVKAAATEAGAPLPSAAGDADRPAGKITVYGDIQIRTASNDGDTTTISNPRMGTVRESEGPKGIQRWEAPSISLEGLADLLDKVAPLSSPVIDMTGLKGRYQLTLEVSLNDAIGARPAVQGDPAERENARMDMEERLLKSFNNGLRPLGLQLEHRKGPVDTLVVDHVERAPTEN
jgi:uncharacterized protein (TIGR03435 family)